MVTETPSGARAVARCDRLGGGPYSALPDGLFRAFLTPEHRAALQALAAWMEEAGMTIAIDAAANLIGRYEGGAPGAPALLIGSHIDSVRDAGRYDGPLGIMLGIELVARLHAAGHRLPFPIEVIAFGDEEGSRFPASMLCSRAIAGTLTKGALQGVRDDRGVSLHDALRDFGISHPMPDAARDPASVIAFLEPHIEQGPVLEANGLALGAVTGIAGQLRFACSVRGIAGHAGTSAMSLRRDAMAAAAEMVLATERIARAGGEGLVATVGRLSVTPGAVNVVPGRVDFSIEVRAADNAVRDRAAAQIVRAMEDIAADRDVIFRHDQVQALSASPCDPALTTLVARAIEAATGAPARRLVSGAGHDTMVMAALCPTAMLFIRCAGGISHSPAESVDPADVEAALDAMEHFVNLLGEATR